MYYIRIMTDNYTADSLSLAYLHGGRMTYSPGDVLGPRLLTDYELVLIVEGNVTYIAEGERFALSPGSIVLGKPGTTEIYEWDTKNPTYHDYVHFTVNHWPDDWPPIDDWQRVFLQPDPSIRPLFRHLLKHLSEKQTLPVTTSNRPESRLIEAMLDILLETHHSVQTAVGTETVPEPVLRALNVMMHGIEEVPMREYSLDELANAAGRTPKHLCRLFTTALGRPPIQTYNLIRLNYAIALLARSGLNINEIATRCGYANHFYFSRSFTKAFGKPPSHMRRDLLAGKPPPENPLPPELMPRMYW